MYLGRKLAGRSWLAANEPALRVIADNQLVIIERPNRRRTKLEVASKSRPRLEKLEKHFGGRIEKLPRDWLKRFLHQPRAKPLKIGGKTLMIPAEAAFGAGEHVTTAVGLRLRERVMPAGWGGSPLGAARD